MSECEDFFAGMKCRRQTGQLSDVCGGSSLPAYPSSGWMEKGGAYYELGFPDHAYDQTSAWKKFCTAEKPATPENPGCQPPGNKLAICDCDKPGYGKVWNVQKCNWDYGKLYEGQYHCIQNCPHGEGGTTPLPTPSDPGKGCIPLDTQVNIGDYRSCCQGEKNIEGLFGLGGTWCRQKGTTADGKLPSTTQSPIAGMDLLGTITLITNALPAIIILALVGAVISIVRR